MTRIAIEQLLTLVNQAFESDGPHSILGNVAELDAKDWDWRPAGADRTIREIFEHVAIAKHLFAEHLFGEAKRSYRDAHHDSPLRARPDDTAALIDWARDGHAQFVAGLQSLEDADLDASTRKHHGAVDTKAAVIGVMVQHDCYHAGEINHLRALRHADDAWEPELMQEPS
ncbi:MAG: DinB family protein [Chloroflexota bacterium]|nr:DinB family protein [Chloroflexota bacterium]